MKNHKKSGTYASDYKRSSDYLHGVIPMKQKSKGNSWKKKPREDRIRSRRK